MKKIIILIIIKLFSLNSVGYAAIDCANPEKMSEKFKCKLSSFKKDNKDKILELSRNWRSNNRLYKQIQDVLYIL